MACLFPVIQVCLSHQKRAHPKSQREKKGQHWGGWSPAGVAELAACPGRHILPMCKAALTLIRVCFRACFISPVTFQWHYLHWSVSMSAFSAQLMVFTWCPLPSAFWEKTQKWTQIPGKKMHFPASSSWLWNIMLPLWKWDRSGCPPYKEFQTNACAQCRDVPLKIGGDATKEEDLWAIFETPVDLSLISVNCSRFTAHTLPATWYSSRRTVDYQSWSWPSPNLCPNLHVLSVMEAGDDDPPGRDEFEKLYPTDHDKLFADINQCPPHLVSWFLCITHVIIDLVMLCLDCQDWSACPTLIPHTDQWLATIRWPSDSATPLIRVSEHVKETSLPL